MASINTTGLCEELAAALPGEVFFPDSAEYLLLLPYCTTIARLIIKPTSAEKVAAALKCLAHHPDVKFAVRSGGHTPNPGHSNVESGITIDLRAFNAIRETNDEKILEVGPGVEWGAIYDHLEKNGRSAVGSRESSVAVGGFITGGGLSFFSPEFGFACDNVQNCEVVLPEGQIVNANANENAELFRAIRGGHCNFGIVTRFDIVTHKREAYWGGGILYPESTEDAQLQAWVDLKSGDYDPYAAVVMSFLYFGAQKSFCISNNMVYLQNTEHPVGLKGFEDIQPQIQGTMRLDTTKNFALELQAWQPLNQYAIYVTTTIKITPTIGKKINSIWRNATLQIADSPNITSVLTYQQFPPQHQDNPNGMGLASDSELHKELLVLIISIYWHTEEDTERIRAVAKDAMDEIEAVAVEENVLYPWKYINYAAFWQEPPKSCGESAVSALKKVSGRYDPDGLFRRQAVGFKLD